ncbi:YncE family protein [Paracoccus liaowanqingii]|uniref:YncE family protein n=2 Tax=Paracoccus liaowanqingii TaxID=2560053 RepID=A0A4Z1CTN6_9RHOB|nr:YncE family protein [Paracoccus liaowanqingii]
MRGWMTALVIALGSPASAGDLAFVTSQNGNALSVVDLDDGRIIAQADIPDAPAPVAYDPAQGRAYVIAAETGRLHVLDEAARPLAQADLGAGAFGLAVAGDGVVVTDWYGARVTRLDADLQPVWSAETGAAPAGVAVSADGALVATADRDADAVSIFDAASGARLHQVATAGAHPFGVTFHDGRLFTADVQGDSVSVIDPGTGRLTGRVATGSHPYALAFAAGRGFVTNQYDGTVTVFDAATLAVLDEVTVGDYPEGIAALPDGSGVAVANWDSNTLVVLDATTLQITRTVEMPAGPRAFGSFTGRPVRP